MNILTQQLVNKLKMNKHSKSLLTNNNINNNTKQNYKLLKNNKKKMTL